MCILGKRSTSSTRVLALTTADQQLIGQSPDRIALVIYPPTSGVATLRVSGAPTHLDGWSIHPGHDPLWLWYDEFGDVVTREWRVIGSQLPGNSLGGNSAIQVVDATAVNAIATATIGAVSGAVHLIDGVEFSFSAAVAGALARVLDGATVLAQYYVHNSLVVPYTFPLVGTSGGAVSADLAAGGVGVTGAVVIHGRTQPGNSIMVTEIFLAERGEQR